MMWHNTEGQKTRSDVVKDMDLDAVVITETWLTGNVSDQKIVGDVTPAEIFIPSCSSDSQERWGVGIVKNLKKNTIKYIIIV